MENTLVGNQRLYLVAQRSLIALSLVEGGMLRMARLTHSTGIVLHSTTKVEYQYVLDYCQRDDSYDAARIINLLLFESATNKCPSSVNASPLHTRNH